MARSAWSAWARFWFESAAPARMSLLRTAICGLTFFFYLTRTPDLEFFFSESGFMPVDVMDEVMPLRFRPSLLNHLTSTPVLWAFHALFLAGLAAMCLGVRSRLVAIATFALHLTFAHRDMAFLYGFDLIATFFLLYLCLADPRGDAPAGSLRAQLGSIAFRFCQIQICIIYGYSGLEKLKGLRWWRGEAIWDVLANSQLARWDFSWATAIPIPIMIATYMTLAWEVYFPVLVWNRRLRYPVLAFGVLLHTGIGIAMNIPYFALIMILAYSVFLEERHAHWVLERLPRLFATRRPPHPVPEAAALPSGAVAGSVASAAADDAA